MRDISAADVARAQLEELTGNAQAELDRALAANRRWVLSLAVGNGAALAALTAKLIDAESEIQAALLIPSCWMFALGLMSSGLVAPITAQRHLLAHQGWKAWTVEFRKGHQLARDERLDRQDRSWYRCELALEVVAATSFAAGLLYPLIVLCHRYLTSGHGFFPPA